MESAELRALAAKKIDEATAIFTAASDDGLTEKEDEKVRALYLTHDKLQDQADLADKITDRKSQLSESTGRPSASVVAERFESDPARGFANHQEFLTAVMNAENTGRMPDKLKALQGVSLTAGSDEQGEFDDTVGGFAVPELFAPGVLTVGTDPDPTIGRTQPVPMRTPTVPILARTDKNHSSSVSGGLTVTNRAETSAIASSRLSIERINLTAHSIFGLAFETEELMEDSPESFTALLASGFDEEFASYDIDKKLNGSGVGEYLGVLNSPAKIAVAKESAQVADTIVGLNLVKMRARCWGYNNAIWMANHDTLPQLVQANLVQGTVGVISLYQQTLREDVPDMIMGRPVFYTEHSDTVGDEGDITLVNWSQYLEGTLQGMRNASSIHVRFLNHEQAFKFWKRTAGEPWWRTALTPKNSAATLSPIITLAVRS